MGGEYAPKMESPDDKKDKKDKKDKDADKKDDKKKDDKKKKKDQITLNNEGKTKAKHCVQNMILGAKGWASWIEESHIERIPIGTPWEFQLAHVVYKCMNFE